MTVSLKTAEDIAGMRIAGKLAADVLEMIAEHVKPGVTTETLNQICHDYIVNVQGAIPAPLNYKGFPKSICTSVNHVVCHGIPGDKPLKDGDTLNIDVTVIKDRYFGDTSRMFHVGTCGVLVLGQDPGHGMAQEHGLGREEWLIVLDAAVVHAGNVGRR